MTKGRDDVIDVPEEFRVAKDRRSITMVMADGTAHELEAEYLRVMSPSAEVQGHGPDERVTVGGKRGVAIRQIEPVGHYAIMIRFDDGHDTGLYTWRYLRELAQDKAERWAAYLGELAAKGLDRDKPGQR